MIRLWFVYKVRVAEQQTVENQLSEIISQIENIKKQIVSLTEHRSKIVNSYLNSFNSVGHSRDIELQTNYINSLMEQEKELNNSLVELEKQSQEKRQEVINAANKVKIIDKLRDNCLSAYIAETSRIEQLFVDELAMLAFVRRGK